MPTEILGALDKIIAVVVVILILTLIVQSVQSFLKKLFSIKSKQIGDSIVELFEHVVGSGKNVRPSARVASPVLRALTFGKDPSDHASPDAKKLFQEVVDRFSKLGRVSPRGKWVTESISKEDLLKIIASVAPNTVLANFTNSLQQVCHDAGALKVALAAVPRADLPGGASAELARVDHILAPLISDCAALLDSQQSVRPNVLLEEVLRVSVDTLDPALTILASIQKTVADAAANAKPADAKLDAANTSVRDVAAAIATFRASFETAFGPLRTRLASVGSWFDTVMQSFEERYTRGMRTWSIVISVVLVILLNANLFKIYETIAANDAVRTELVDVMGKNLLKEKADEDKVAAASESEAATPATTTETATATTTDTATADNPQTPLETENLKPAPESTEGQKEQRKSELEAARKELAEDREKAEAGVRKYLSLGLTPFTLEDLSTWARGFFRVDLPDVRGTWWRHRADDFRTLFGWFVMVVLLSFGAPFWHDALETLFGVKNLVRKRSSTQNVETPAGAGNPKP